jgi:flagellar motor switch protein FliM
MFFDDENNNTPDNPEGTAPPLNDGASPTDTGTQPTTDAGQAPAADAAAPADSGEDVNMADWGLGAEGDANGEQPVDLNQNDIDSLFGGVTDGPKGLKAILEAGFVHYERLPMLEVVFDRLSRVLTTTLRNFTGENVEVSLKEMTSIRFGNYLDTIALPAMIGVFKAEEWENHGLIVTDTPLIYAVIDILLGGRRGHKIPRIEGRPYTSIERRLVERMMQIVLMDMAGCFNPLTPVTFHFERLETNPRFATIARTGNAAILVKLAVELEDKGGEVQILLPYATLEPVREILLQSFMGEKFGRDSIWESHLAHQLWGTEIELEAILSHFSMPLDQMLNLEVGSRIMFTATPHTEIEICCGGQPMFTGFIGHQEEFMAVKVGQILYTPPEIG